MNVTPPIEAPPPALRKELLAILAEDSGPWIRFAEASSAEAPTYASRIPPESLAQLVNGVMAVLREATLGESRELWDLTIGATIPGYFGGGAALSSAVLGELLGGTATNFLLFQSFFCRRLSDAVRPEGELWLARFFGRYLRQVLVRAQEYEATR